MRFWLLDAIESFEKDSRLSAFKNVSYSEEYLQDHFPEFPVLPGVFMLEAATQASAWLLRLSTNYQHSIITLKEARNVKYADFVAPGQRLELTTELMKQEERTSSFKVTGNITGSPSEKPCVSGRLVLEHYNLAETDPLLAETDERLFIKFRKWQDVLVKPCVLEKGLATTASDTTTSGTVAEAIA